MPLDATARLNHRYCTTLADFMALRTDWNRLAEATDPGNVFLRHEWFTSAWDWRSQDAQLCILEARESDMLCGIVPMIRWREARTRYLGFLTVPDTQSCAMLAANEHANALAACLGRALHDLADWDVLCLTHLDKAAKATGMLRDALSGQLAMQTQEQGENPGIALAEDWESYYARRSRRLKKGNNLIANTLARQHQVALQHITQVNTDAGDIEPLLATLIELSQHSWKTSTGLTLDRPGPQAFLRTLTAEAAREGWLSIWLLHLDNRPVAVEYQLRYRGMVHALRADYLTEHAGLSPGTYLNWKMLKQLFTGDDRFYWMGPGDNAYKQRWAEIGRPLVTLRVFNNTALGRWMALRTCHLRPLYHRLRSLVNGRRGERSS